MSNGSRTPNNVEVLAAKDSITGLAAYVTSTGRKLDVNATASLAGVAIPIVGATTAVGVAIVDGSGNQITSFGGGTQYTDAGTPPAHPVGPTLEFNNAGAWATVGSATPLPVTIAGGLSNPLPVSLTSTTITGTVTTAVTYTASSNATSTAYEASRVVKASAGVLYGITGYNSKASIQFIQLFNSTTVPADTTVPVVTFTVPASSPFAIDWGERGRNFTTGIAVSNSSTGPTKTIGSADCFFDAQYI